VSEPIHTEIVALDGGKSYSEQTDEIAQRLETELSISVFGESQTHYVNTSVDDDGQILVSVFEAGS
jgi:hypothetical protein